MVKGPKPRDDSAGTPEPDVVERKRRVGAGKHMRFVVDKAKTFERLKAKAARFAAQKGGA